MTSRNPASVNIPKAKLISQRDALVSRLNEGDRQIQMARANGSETARLETLWIRLLREYEAVCRVLDQKLAEPLATAA